MKSLVKLMLVFGITVLSIPFVNVSADFDLKAANGYDNVLAWTDFSSGEMDGNLIQYKNEYDNEIASIVEAPVEKEKYGYVLKLPTNPGTANSSGQNLDSFMRIKYEHIDPNYNADTAASPQIRAKLSQAKLEMDIMFDTFLNSHIQLIDYDCTNETGYGIRSSIKPITFYADGTAKFLNGHTFEYETNRWYSIILYMDYTRNQYSACIDGELVAKNYTIETGPKPRIATLGFGFYIEKTGITAYVYFDNLKYSVPNYYSGIKSTRTVFSDDFENGITSERHMTKGIITTETASVDAQSHGKVAVIVNKDSEGAYTDSYLRSSYNFVNKDAGSQLLTGEKLQEAKHAIVNVDILLRDYLNGDFHVVGHSSPSSRPAISVVKFTNNGDIKLYDGTKFRYETGIWYRFKAIMDFETGTYSIYLNDELLRSGISFSNLPVKHYMLSAGVQILTVDSDVTVEVDNLNFSFVTYSDDTRIFEIRQTEDLSKLVLFNKSIEDVTYTLQQKRLIVESNFDGDTLPPGFGSKGIVTHTSASVDLFNHGGVVQLRNRDSNGNPTDAFYRPHYDYVNKYYSQELLTGEELAEAQEIMYQVDILLDAYGMFGIQVICHVDLSTRPIINLVSYEKNGDFKFLNGPTFTYRPNEWNSFKFYINFKDLTYTAWLNDELVVQDVTLGTTAYKYALSCGVYFMGALNQTEVVNAEIDNYKFEYVNRQTLIEYISDYSDMIFIAAAYDANNGKLISVDYVPYEQLQLKEISVSTANIDMNGHEGKKYYMIWKLDRSMKPLAKKTLVQ